MPISPRLGRWVAALLLAALGSSYVVAISRKTLTTDELIHISAGYNYWTIGNFALSVRLPACQKGAHMSRFVEVLAERLSTSAA